MYDNSYYKRRYMIAFYKDTKEKDDERLVEIFDNSQQICKYRKLPLTQNNLLKIKVELYNALKRNPPITRMLDGTSMKVYLIDMLEELEEQERRDKCMPEKKFVKISSSINIEVYGNFESLAMINSDHKLNNVKPGWAKIRILITQGVNWYPSEILEWNAIKRLVEKEILTVSEQRDTLNDAELEQKVEAQRKLILKGYKALKRDKEKIDEINKANKKSKTKED